MRIEATISEVKGACSDDCATDVYKQGVGEFALNFRLTYRVKLMGFQTTDPCMLFAELKCNAKAVENATP